MAKIVKRFGETDGRTLGLRLLREAIDQQYGDGLVAASVVAGSFGFDAEHFDILIRVATAEWHTDHENIATTLASYRDIRALPTLVKLATWIPQHEEGDDIRALAVKAIWGIGNLPGSEAEDALRDLTHDEDKVVREAAEYQLVRRAKQAG
ncbi:hypothetical protein D5S17_29525 [Pseudonocardiaceae bacterium YIM PH 21723]|nr:hypothetical protein D5S17_29525 [Pseudonocardiaceae bacterium YIM PH 21723]